MITCGHPRSGAYQTMSEKEAKKCPKSGGEMAPGEPITGWDVLGFDVAYLPFRLKKPGDTVDSNIHAFYCKNCGYVEFYAKK
jgi:hypothetical protein